MCVTDENHVVLNDVIFKIARSRSEAPHPHLSIVPMQAFASAPLQVFAEPSLDRSLDAHHDFGESAPHLRQAVVRLHFGLLRHLLRFCGGVLRHVEGLVFRAFAFGRDRLDVPNGMNFMLSMASDGMFKIWYFVLLLSGVIG